MGQAVTQIGQARAAIEMGQFGAQDIDLAILVINRSILFFKDFKKLV